MLHRLAPASLLLFAPGLFGCDGHKASSVPLGSPLGTFHVVAHEIDNGCGQGAMGAPATWEFDVELSRDAHRLYWDNGAQTVIGTMASDGTSFEVAATVVMDMRSGGAASGPPCRVRRDDLASGQLSSEGLDVRELSGVLGYDFAVTAGSQCIDLVEGSTPVFATLPCAIDYDFEATRIAAPR